MKYKCSLIDNLIPLTSCQIDILIALIQRSDEQFALVRGAYYKDIIKGIRGKGCCNQTFYNSLEALEEHGIIRVSKQSDLDFDVYICGNEYSEHSKDAFEKMPYINFNHEIFSKNAFKRLKAHEKYLFLYFFQYTFENNGKRTKKINKADFYKKMTEKLNVTTPVLRGYLRNLKLFYSIGTLDGNLLVTRLAATNKNGRKEKTEEYRTLEQYITSQCRRLHMKFEENALSGLVEYVKNHRKQFKKHGTLVVLSQMMKVMKKSIEGYKWSERTLNGAYVNKLLHPKLMSLPENTEPEISEICNFEKLDLCF